MKQGGNLGGAHLGVVDRIGHQPVPIVGDAEPLGGVASRFRGDLHQPNRLGRRHVALIEGAFRAHDRIDDAAIELGTDRTVRRHADVGKSVLVHRASRARAPSCR